MSEFRAFIRDDDIMLEGPDEKIEFFSQFLDEMEEATDSSLCDCKSNDRVKSVVSNYFPDYVEEIMELFEDNDGFCDCEVGVSAMSQSNVIKKLGRYMDSQEI